MEVIEQMNDQLKTIIDWCLKKQKQEELSVKGDIVVFHDYFREFYTDFNLPESVGLKTQSEILNQNLMYNELYKKHKNLIGSLKCLKEKIEQDKKSGQDNKSIYIKQIKQTIDESSFDDLVNDELRNRGVKGV